MLKRLIGLYRRYADRHLSFRFGPLLIGPDPSRPVAAVDEMRLQGGRLIVKGWTTGASVSVAADTGTVRVAADDRREDVIARFGAGIGTPRNFALDLPAPPGHARLEATVGETVHGLVLPTPSFGYRLRREFRLLLYFLRDAAHAAPFALRWLLFRDIVARARLKTALRMDAHGRALPLSGDIFRRPEGPVRRPGDPVTIILPIFNAFDMLPEVLERIETHTDIPWQLLLVEDCSTDAQVRPFLRHWAQARAQVELLENAENLGFVGAVNRGLQRARELPGHVVLMNSDTFVPPGWAGRLLAPILGDDGIASVTPMSNDAEIFNVPVICAPMPLAPGQGDAIDAVAQTIAGGAVEAPTGVGFCMAMNRRFLEKLPGLDPAFGRGYGEEVDWCQRVRALGGRHLGLPGLFVEHRGGASFGSGAKRALIAKNNALIARRYPTYDRDVQNFIAADPLMTARLALGLAWLDGAGDGPVSIFLGHSLGGGAEHALERDVRHQIDSRGGAVVLRVGGRLRWRIELHSAAGVTAGITGDDGLVARLLDPIGARRIVYSCALGDRDPAGLPGFLLGLRRTPRDRIEVLFHDFLPISPSFCLLESDERYRGIGAQDPSDPAHRAKRPDGTALTLADWQAQWGQLVAAADRVICFSENSAAHVRATWPELPVAITVEAHGMPRDFPPLEPTQSAKPVIGVLGAINVQKGGRIVTGIARELERTGQGRIVLIGHLDPMIPAPRSLTIHGSYRPQDIPELARRHGVTCWLIPSIWPETFSFTTHECLATGLPVYGFDIGAQGDAIAAAENGQVISFEGDLVENVIAAIVAGHDERPG